MLLGSVTFAVKTEKGPRNLNASNWPHCASGQRVHPNKAIVSKKGKLGPSPRHGSAKKSELGARELSARLGMKKNALIHALGGLESAVGPRLGGSRGCYRFPRLRTRGNRRSNSGSTCLARHKGVTRIARKRQNGATGSPRLKIRA